MNKEQTEALKKFDEIAYSYVESGWGGGEKVKVANAEHLGDVVSKLLPELRQLFKEELSTALQQKVEEMEEIVSSEMDNSTHLTNAEFIACDDLAIKILKRIRSLKINK